MTYQKIVEQKETDHTEVKLYTECDSFEEFELKRTIQGIIHKWLWNDKFKIYYFLQNNRKWIRADYCQDFSITFGVMSCLAFVSMILSLFIFDLTLFAVVQGMMFIFALFISMIFFKFHQSSSEVHRLYKDFNKTQGKHEDENFLNINGNTITIKI